MRSSHNPATELATNACEFGDQISAQTTITNENFSLYTAHFIRAIAENNDKGWLNVLALRILRAANKAIGYNSRHKEDSTTLSTALNCDHDHIAVVISILNSTLRTATSSIDDQSKKLKLEKLEYELANINFISAIEKSTNNDVKQAARHVLTATTETYVKNPSKAAEITKSLNAATSVVEKPDNLEHIGTLQQHARSLGKRSWGRVLGGAMLALAGTALIAGFTATALVTFGAIAPVSILGVVVGTSMVAGGLAVAGAAVGVGYGITGSFLIAQGAKKSGRVKESLENLVNTAKPKR